MIEVENLAAVPCGIAFAVRPFGVDGPGSGPRVAPGRAVLHADGRPVLVLLGLPAARWPERARTGTWRCGSARGEAVLPSFEPVTSPAGLAQAVVVLPIAHATSVRVVVPLADRSGSVAEATTRVSSGAPIGGERCPRLAHPGPRSNPVIVPDPRLQAVIDAGDPGSARRALLRSLADGGRTMWDPRDVRRWDHVAALAGLLDRGAPRRVRHAARPGDRVPARVDPMPLPATTPGWSPPVPTTWCDMPTRASPPRSPSARRGSSHRCPHGGRARHRDSPCDPARAAAILEASAASC